MAQRLRTVLGLDIGGTKIACIEGSRAGEILQRVEMATNASRPFDETLPAIVAALQRLIASAEASARRIVALSVSIGGPLRIGEGVLIDPPNLPGWHGVRLKDRLSGAFPGSRSASSMTATPGPWRNFISARPAGEPRCVT